VTFNIGGATLAANPVMITKLGETFEVRTPTAVAGVIGTDFGVDAHHPNETEFVCITGTVRIYTPDKKHYVDCGPGSKLAVKRGEPLPTKASPAFVDSTERWKHITEPGDTLFPDPIPED
jgi:ferric-dicitrate binding protein FerR (iron transport regulator)